MSSEADPLCKKSAIFWSLGLGYVGGLVLVMGQDVKGEKGCQSKETQDPLLDLVDDC